MSYSERKITLKESKILEHLKHPNITTFREVYKTKSNMIFVFKINLNKN